MKLTRSITLAGTSRQLRAAGAITAALLSATAIAACGGSSKSSSASAGTTTSASKSGSNAKFVACLKQHGVTIKLPTGTGTGTGRTPTGTVPSGGGGPAGTGTVPSGGAPAGAPSGTTTTGSRRSFRGGFFGGKSSTKDEAAFKACAKYEVRGSFGRGRYGATGGAGRATYSTATLTKFVTCVRKNGYPQMPNASKTTSGGFFPKSIENNKKFQAAAKKCTSILQPSGGAPGANTGTSTTAAS